MSGLWVTRVNYTSPKLQMEQLNSPTNMARYSYKAKQHYYYYLPQEAKAFKYKYLLCEKRFHLMATW